MRNHTKILARTIVLATAGWFAACNSTIDTEPNVVLEVELVTIPPLTPTRDQVDPTVCNFVLTNASATFKNKPKNALAGTSPFNDIVLQDVIVTYAWDDQVGVASATFGVGGTVPAGGSATSLFAVVNVIDLSTPLRAGHTANLTMTFRGTTVNGDPVSTTTGGSLTVNSCPAAVPAP